MDMRPQSFMGKAFAQAHSELSLPLQLAHWTDEHILRALVDAGEDLPGSLLVGKASLDRYLALPRACPSTAPVVSVPEHDYPQLAQQALCHALPCPARLQRGRRAARVLCLACWRAGVGQVFPCGRQPGRPALA